MAQAPEKTTSFGSCPFERINPAREELDGATQKMNIVVSFDNALKLNLAIQSALLSLNKLKRSSTQGKRAAINIVVDFDVKNVAIMPAKLSQK